MPQSLAKRYAGHEQEILRDIKIHGNIKAMTKWGGSWLAWEKYVETIKGVYDEKESLRLNDIIFSDHKSLAEHLVEQFTSKVVTLENKCREQKSRIDFLEKQLSIYRDKNDELLADKIIKALEVVGSR